MSIRFLLLEEILQLHQSSIQKYGGSLGLRDEKLLLSALEMPSAGFGDQYFHTSIYEMAAAYAFHISKNHPFVGGNKRTALGAMHTFLVLNSYDLLLSQEEAYDFIVDIATGALADKKDIAAILEKHSTHITQEGSSCTP